MAQTFSSTEFNRSMEINGILEQVLFLLLIVVSDQRRSQYLEAFLAIPTLTTN